MRTSNVTANGKIRGTKENGPGVNAANTDVIPGPRPQQHYLED